MSSSSTKSTKKYVAWYSLTQQQINRQTGSKYLFTYKTSQHTNVVATDVMEVIDGKKKGDYRSNFDDAVYLGEVVEWVNSD